MAVDKYGELILSTAGQNIDQECQKSGGEAVPTSDPMPNQCLAGAKEYIKDYGHPFYDAIIMNMQRGKSIVPGVPIFCRRE